MSSYSAILSSYPFNRLVSVTEHNKETHLTDACGYVRFELVHVKPSSESRIYDLEYPADVPAYNFAVLLREVIFHRLYYKIRHALQHSHKSATHND